jgi:hypothetical protein
MKPDVFSFVDHTHAAAAQLLDDSVVRDGLADHSKLRGLQVPSSYGRGIRESTNDGSDGSDPSVPTKNHCSVTTYGWKLGDNSRFVGNPSLTGLWKGCPSSDHNRELGSAESPLNTTRLLAGNLGFASANALSGVRPLLL